MPVCVFGSKGETLASYFPQDAQNPIWAEAALKLTLFMKPFLGVAAYSHAQVHAPPHSHFKAEGRQHNSFEYIWGWK